jgi:hypothetical protein
VSFHEEVAMKNDVHTQQISDADECGTSLQQGPVHNRSTLLQTYHRRLRGILVDGAGWIRARECSCCSTKHANPRHWQEKLSRRTP